MIIGISLAAQAAQAAITFAEGAGLALVLTAVALVVRRLRLGTLWNAFLQLVTCSIYLGVCLYAEFVLFLGTFEFYRIVCFCGGGMLYAFFRALLSRRQAHP